MKIFDKYDKNINEDDLNKEINSLFDEVEDEIANEKEQKREEYKIRNEANKEAGKQVSPQDMNNAIKEKMVIPNQTAFTFLVKEQRFADDKIKAFGNVKGEVRKGNKVMIYIPENKVFTFEVEELFDIDGKECDFLADQPGYIVVPNAKSQMPEYAVMSSYLVLQQNNKKDITNPLLMAFLREFNELKHESSYLNVFMYVLVHSDLWVVARQEEDNRFSPVFLNDDKENKMILPFFADILNANDFVSSMGKQLSGENKSITLLTMRFNQLADKLYNEGHSIVVNPMSEDNARITNELIGAVINSPAYQKEMEDKNNNQ